MSKKLISKQEQINKIATGGVTKEQASAAIDFSEAYSKASYKEQQKMKSSPDFQNYMHAYKVTPYSRTQAYEDKVKDGSARGTYADYFD